MAQVTSGRVLREARERKGYDLNTVARRLRIRPDILRAIEAGDFSTMPPRGYTRNMINAYARLLGLNPTEIVNMYLDEAYANQVERARDSAPQSRFSMEPDTRRGRNRGTQASASSNRTFESGRTSTIRNGKTQTTRVLYDDGTRYARDDYGVTRERTARPGKSDRDFLSHHSGYDSSSTSSYASESSSRFGSQKSVYAGQTPNSWSASRIPEPIQNILGALKNLFQNRIAVIVAAVVLVLLVAGVAFAVSGSHGNDKDDDASKLPVSGVADTTGDSSSASSATPVELAPTSARVIYSVPSGKECYVETYLDGQMTPEMLTGPVERSVEVTGVWVITTYSPETLNLTVDGSAVTMKVDQQYGGMYSYTVDFPSILQKWNTDHGISGAAARTTTNTSTTTNSAAAQSTSTSTSGQEQRQTYEESVNYDTSLSEEDQANEQEGQAQTDVQESYDEPQEYYEEPTYEEPVYDESQDYYEEPQETYEEPVYTEEYAQESTEETYDDGNGEQY